jgi:CrcB protein
VSAPILLAVGVLGGLGAVARVLVAAAIDGRSRSDFPAGILAINLGGTFLAGVVAGVALAHDADLLLAGGLLGAYTTFSTWVFDSERLARGSRVTLAVANIAGSLILGLAAVWLGRTAGLAV